MAHVQNDTRASGMD